MVKTSHTLFPVECVYAARDAVGRSLLPRGKLADVAPTVLRLLGLAVPPEMSAEVLILGLP
jgi:2,3-bisphosphoglycerate-independent phosphoglycerate mutase